MAEVVGTVSAVLGLAIIAYDASRKLYDEISSFKSQRRTIKDLQTDLDSLVTVIASIRDQAQNPQEQKKLEPLRQPLTCCTAICQEMRDMLDECKKHSKDGHDSIRVWLSLRYREKSFEDVKQRLASYKSTLVIVFESININEHSTTHDSLQELKDSISGTKDDLEDQMDRLEKAMASASSQLQGVLQHDLAQLKTCLDSVAQAEQVAASARPKIVVKENEGGQGSRTIFGTDASKPDFDLEVSKNKAALGATMGAGSFTPETLQALLRDSRTPEVALVLEALQTQSANTQTTVIKNLVSNMSAQRQLQDEIVDSTPGAGIRVLEDVSTTEDAPPLPKAIEAAQSKVAREGSRS